MGHSRGVCTPLGQFGSPRSAQVLQVVRIQFFGAWRVQVYALGREMALGRACVFAPPRRSRHATRSMDPPKNGEPACDAVRRRGFGCLQPPCKAHAYCAAFISTCITALPAMVETPPRPLRQQVCRRLCAHRPPPLSRAADRWRAVVCIHKAGMLHPTTRCIYIHTARFFYAHHHPPHCSHSERRQVSASPTSTPQLRSLRKEPSLSLSPHLDQQPPCCSERATRVI